MKGDAGKIMLEYALLLAVGVAGLLGVELYLKRSVTGELRNAANAIGETQYLPGHMTSDERITMHIEQDQIVTMIGPDKDRSHVDSSVDETTTETGTVGVHDAVANPLFE